MSTTRVGEHMTKSGFCQYPAPGSHAWCRDHGYLCDCVCHKDPSAVAEQEARLEALAAGYPESQEA